MKQPDNRTGREPAAEEPYAPGSAQLRRVRQFNRIARVILGSPLHRLLSDKLMLITFTGRKTGRSYTTPVAYARDGAHLLIGAGGLWRENLVSQPHVRVRLHGRVLGYRAAVVDDEHEYDLLLRRMATLNPTWAERSGLELGGDGMPTAEAIARARARGLKMVRLEPETRARS